MNPERVELLGNAEFVRDREIDAFTLAAIAQGRIVYFHFGFHNIPAMQGNLIYASIRLPFPAESIGQRTLVSAAKPYRL